MMFSQTVLPQASASTADFELVLRARKGDRLAQEELARRHRRPMYFLALQLLGNPDDAMDVVQDALVRFLTTIHRFDPKRPFVSVDGDGKRETDFLKMMRIVLKAGYRGWVGIESEGPGNQDEGVRKTLAMLEGVREKLAGEFS